MGEELKPCPFCGSADVNVIDQQAVCHNCHAINGDPTDLDFPTIPEWNHRPIEDELRARIKELEAENAKLKAEIDKLAVFAAIHGFGGYTISEPPEVENE
jgi:hypothetical protein